MLDGVINTKRRAAVEADFIIENRLQKKELFPSNVILISSSFLVFV